MPHKRLLLIIGGDGLLAMEVKHLTFVFPIALLFYVYSNFNKGRKVGISVRVTGGVVEGSSGVSRDGREFYEFLGIPYARPPVGELRFEPPQPVLPWDGHRFANEHSSPCTQIELFTKKLLGREDCLYLNVFTPKKNSGKNGNLLPVMVYIHGGYFMSGSAIPYRPEYFMDQDIILVTINYRTAALGFLNTGDGLVRGNMGMKDQAFALKWVQKNIIQFGGDSSRVTIFGASAGAAGVGYHIISPMSKGLFHKAISQSGSAIKVWSFVSRPAEQAKRLGKQLNCPTENTTALVSCLKKLDANVLTAAHWEYIDVFLDPLAIYAPSIEAVNDENTFLAEHPYEILKNGKQNQVPWICGLNADEGLLYTARIIENQEIISRINTDWETTAPSLLAYSENPQRKEITSQVRKFYLGDKSEVNFLRDIQNFTNMLSDRLYFTASRETALLQKLKSPVFAYYNTYKSQFSFSSILQLSGRFPAILELGWDFVSNWIHRNIFRRETPSLGVCHGDELVMLFQLPVLSNILPDHVDYNMSKAFVKLWTDFASADTYDYFTFQNVKWRPVGPGPKLKYLNLDSKAKIIDEPFTERADFWKRFGLL